MSRAQETRPNITPEAKPPAKKSNNGPRAVGILQMSSDGKVTLVPIMIKVDGKFYDASSYKANPVPMALDGGTVYEGERSGSSVGLFTVNSALHSLAQNVQDPWIGTGIWLPSGAEAPKKGRRAEDAPVGLETKDEPPRLKKGTSSGDSEKKGEPAVSPSSSAPASGSVPVTPTASTGSNSSDAKPAASQSTPAASTPSNSTPSSASTQSSTSTPAQTPNASSANLPSAANSSDKNKDTNDKKDDKGSDKEKDKSAVSSAPADDRPRNADESRPRLRRGKPVEPSADYDVPGYGKLGTTAKGPASVVARKTIDLVPAISDAGGPDPHTYKFEWLKGEEDDRRKQLIDFAKKQVQAYVEEQAKNKISAVPTPAKTPVKKAATKTPEPVLENIQLRAFDVWTNNQPVMILMADAHIPQPGEKPGAAPAALPGSGEPPMQYSITLVARTDIYNNLHKLYSGVTDKFHLDINPKLELIDAVDADGDGRGELLFHKITDAGTGYAIYRPTADTLWKMFDTLNP